MNERRRAIINAREEDDILGLVNLLRSGLVRNLGNITTPRLFNRAYAGTKLLIEEYITQVALAIEYVTALPTTQSDESGWTSQAKLDLLHDTRQAFGRSTLVLQGGAMFGLCHLGVVKALHLRGLLPRIITGTATGALIAALVGIHTEDELLDFLNGDGIDLTAFARHSEEASSTDDKALIFGSRSRTVQTLLRRIRRFIREGYFLDVNVLEECVRANVGDLTFEEAYARTRRVLNITVATSGRGGVPNLLNYLTAPNVVRNIPHISTQEPPINPSQTAHLVRRPSLQRLLHNPLLTCNPKMQRRNGRHRPLGLHARNHLSLLAPSKLQRPRLPPLPHRRTLQRQPFRRLPSPPLYRPLSPTPLPTPQQHPKFSSPPPPPPSPHQTPNSRNRPPPPPTRLPLPPPSPPPQTPNRRKHARRQPHPRARPPPRRFLETTRNPH